MSNTITNAFWLFIVSMLWGSTNPLIRKGSKGIEDIHRSSRIRQFLAEIYFLVSNWKLNEPTHMISCHMLGGIVLTLGMWLSPLIYKYIIPFLLNQCGSVVYYLTLASVDLSIAVPITNSLTLIITTLTGKLFGEGDINAGTFVGMCLVISGVTICVMDKAAA